MAKAIGAIRSSGINVSLIDINNSDYGFTPDAKNNIIRFGLKGLNAVNTDSIEAIFAHRPYTGIVDFMQRCPMKKTVMISLIKAGAFDELDAGWASKITKQPRTAIMAYYISKVSEPKTKLTLQNFNTLIQRNLLPQELEFEIKVFEFNRYLKAYCKNKEDYIFDERAYNFFTQNFNENIELMFIENHKAGISQKTWKKIYDKVMNSAREWLKNNQAKTLVSLNDSLFKENWNKYAAGSISAWEMDSLCFYYHDHELAHIDNTKYGIEDFNAISNLEVDYYFKRGGYEIPVYKIHRIAGTVIGKNDTRSSISLLTTGGVVNVKFTKEYYAMANRQISQANPDGTKTVVDKSWFRRGTKLLIAGYHRDDTFVAKTYSKTVGHQLYLISQVNGKDIELKYERAGYEEEC